MKYNQICLNHLWKSDNNSYRIQENKQTRLILICSFSSKKLTNSKTTQGQHIF